MCVACLCGLALFCSLTAPGLTVQCLSLGIYSCSFEATCCGQGIQGGAVWCCLIHLVWCVGSCATHFARRSCNSMVSSLLWCLMSIYSPAGMVWMFPSLNKVLVSQRGISLGSLMVVGTNLIWSQLWISLFTDYLISIVIVVKSTRRTLQANANRQDHAVADLSRIIQWICFWLFCEAIFTFIYQVVQFIWTWGWSGRMVYLDILMRFDGCYCVYTYYTIRCYKDAPS